jgi:hypothetical protein
MIQIYPFNLTKKQDETTLYHKLMSNWIKKIDMWITWGMIMLFLLPIVIIEKITSKEIDLD